MRRWCHTSRAVIKMSIVGNENKISLTLLRLNVYSLVMTHSITLLHPPAIKPFHHITPSLPYLPICHFMTPHPEDTPHPSNSAITAFYAIPSLPHSTSHVIPRHHTSPQPKPHMPCQHNNMKTSNNQQCERCTYLTLKLPGPAAGVDGSLTVTVA